MATDGLSLLFKLKASNEASPAIKATQADIAKLTSSTSAQFGQMQAVTTRSLGLVTQNLTQVASRVPVVGTAVSGLTTTFGTMTTATGSASVGLGVFAGAAVLGAAATGALIGGIFKLAKETADYAANLHDVSQQLGIGTVLLSTLSVAADTSGASFTGATTALGKYLKNVSDANAGNEELRKKFIQVGFTQKDLTEAHKDSDTAITILIDRIGSLSNNQDRLNALQKVGVRNGQDLNGIIKAMDGNYAEFQKRVAAMGLAITPEQAIAADKFDDSLKFLELTIKGLAFTFGREFIPVIMSGFNEVQSGLQNNQSAWTFWAKRVREEIIGVRVAYAGLEAFIAAGGGIGAVPAAIAAAAVRNRELKSLAGQVIAGVSGVGPTRAIGEDDDGAAKKAREAQQRANKEIALSLQELEEITRVNRIALERERELDLKTIKEWEDESINAAQNHLAQQQIIFDQEKENIRQFVKNRQDQSLALREIDQKDEKAQNDFFIAVQKTRDDATKQRNQLDLALNRELAEIRDATREGELRRIKEQLDRGIIVESEAITRTLALLKDEHEQRLLLIDLELTQETTSAKRKVELDNDKIRSEQRFTDEKKRLTEERIDTANREAAATAPGVGGVPEGDESGIGFDIEELLGPPPEERFNAWKDAFQELKNIGADAMRDLAFGIGSLVQNWVLLGETGPKAMRKLVASVLAGVAAQAAVKAVFQLAEGFAALFINPAEAAAHFTSAAIFASIAGVAAVAGRAVAGDAFKQNVNDRSSRGSGISSTTSGSDRRDPIDLVRNPPQPQVLILRVESNDSHILSVLQQDVNRNGGFRDLIIETAGS